MASLGTSSGKKAVVEPGESRVTMLSTDVVNAARMVLDAVHSVPVLPDRKGPGPSLTLEEVGSPRDANGHIRSCVVRRRPGGTIRACLASRARRYSCPT